MPYIQEEDQRPREVGAAPRRQILAVEDEMAKDVSLNVEDEMAETEMSDAEPEKVEMGAKDVLILVTQDAAEVDLEIDASSSLVLDPAPSSSDPEAPAPDPDPVASPNAGPDDASSQLLFVPELNETMRRSQPLCRRFTDDDALCALAQDTCRLHDECFHGVVPAALDLPFCVTFFDYTNRMCIQPNVGKLFRSVQAEFVRACNMRQTCAKDIERWAQPQCQFGKHFQDVA